MKTSLLEESRRDHKQSRRDRYTEAPRLSWNISTPQRNWMQGVYQVLVSSDSSLLSVDQGDIWNSGKIRSGDCLYVPYRGLPLESQ